MSPELREREATGAGNSPVLVCLKCVSDYRAALRGECDCREANEAAGYGAEFRERAYSGQAVQS